MGKNKLFIGMMVGAVIGGLATLTDTTTRDYTKRKIQDTTHKTKKAFQNPSDAIQNVKTTFNQYNETIQNGADNAINAFEQVENTLDKLSKNRKSN